MQRQQIHSSELFLLWTTRILAIFFTVFLGIFALDSFNPAFPVSTQIAAFLIHLMPNYLLLAALILAWKKEVYGGLLFIAIGMFFTLFFQTYLMIPNFMLVSFPVFIIGVLFLIHHFLSKKGIHTKS